MDNNVVLFVFFFFLNIYVAFQSLQHLDDSGQIPWKVADGRLGLDRYGGPVLSAAVCWHAQR